MYLSPKFVIRHGNDSGERLLYCIFIFRPIFPCTTGLEALTDCKSTAQALMRFYLLFIYLFGILRCFQHFTGHITTGSWKCRGNQYIQFVRVLYCKLPTNGKQLPAFPLEAVPGIEPRPQRWEARVLPLCHRGPPHVTDVLLTESVG